MLKKRIAWIVCLTIWQFGKNKVEKSLYWLFVSCRLLIACLSTSISFEQSVTRSFLPRLQCKGVTSLKNKSTRPKTDVKLKKLIYIGTRKQQFGGVLTGNTNAKDIISFYKEQVNGGLDRQLRFLHDIYTHKIGTADCRNRSTFSALNNSTRFWMSLCLFLLKLYK